MYTPPAELNWYKAYNSAYLCDSEWILQNLCGMHPYKSLPWCLSQARTSNLGMDTRKSPL